MAIEIPGEETASSSGKPELNSWSTSPSGRAHDKPPVIPLLKSSRLRLREIYPSDYGFLYQLAMSPETGFRWRFRGAQPTYEDFVRGIGHTVLAQYLIVSQGNNTRLGLAACYQADFRNKTAYLALVGIKELQETGALIEAAQLFTDFVFGCYEFDKLYAECPGFNFHQFSSGLGSLYEEEGRLRNHERFLAASWDLHILALYRHKWQSMSLERENRRQRTIESSKSKQDGAGLSFDDFSLLLGSEFDIADDLNIGPDTRLVYDLNFDSLQMYELMCFLEDLGVPVSEGRMSSIKTIQDVYSCYLHS